MASTSRRDGFVYVATGPKYLEEAVRSAESLRQHHRNHRICLITDSVPTDRGAFDDIVIATSVAHQPVDKLLAIGCPYERFIFLDSDTRVFGDLSPLLDLLDEFDVAAHQDIQRGWHYELPGVPLAFSEFNTGVLAFRRSARVEGFFRQWADTFVALQAEFGFVSDQPAFRRALFHSDLRIAPIPSEFHFLGNFPNSLLWTVRVIHGRGDLDRMKRQVDEVLGPRVYVPEVGVIPRFLGRRSWLTSTVRTARRMANLLVRPPSDSAAANPSHWWLEEQRASSLRAGKPRA